MKFIIWFYIGLCVYIFSGFAYCLIVHIVMERHAKNKERKVLYIMNQLNMIRPPLQPKLLNKTFEEFVHYEKYEKSRAATLAHSLLKDGEDNQIDIFGYKLDYYWYCIKDLNSVQKEILELWNEYFNLFENWADEYNLKIFLNQLSSLTINAGISKYSREKIDTQFIRVLERHYHKLLKELNFYNAIKEILSWYEHRVDYYYKIMGIGTTETELYFLEMIYKNFEKEIEQLKTDSPPTFITFTKYVYYFYVNLPEILDRNYDYFYRYNMLSRIVVLKNIGEYEKMSESIYLFKKSYKKKKKGLKLVFDHVLDFGAGYGEKPYRLIIHFVILQVIFFFVYFPYNETYSKEFIVIKGLNENNNLFENIIDIIYFNSTTLMSNLYGNISPDNWLAKLIVTFQQVIGFIVTGSFITLFLRKLFRD